MQNTKYEPSTITPRLFVCSGSWDIRSRVIFRAVFPYGRIRSVSAAPSVNETHRCPYDQSAWHLHLFSILWFETHTPLVHTLDLFAISALAIQAFPLSSEIYHCSRQDINPALFKRPFSICNQLFAETRQHIGECLNES